MGLENLRRPGGPRKARKRIGRGQGSGTGGTSGAGHKGARSRSGFKRKKGFEGGQMPLQRRVPKVGFTNIFRVEYQVVNVRDLERAGGKEITLDTLIASGLVRNMNKPVKILGTGELTEAYNVSANAFSKSAVEKIEAAGGKTTTV
ncbi:MAG: 50S ribosomal protein L15 [Candidatus Marinimicrobia bacterium]|nr:50S ribosomal protein L15 [Candidatus Neomarinimicrobiota bacterium]MCH8304195.1 50S ribosomal protein L15 [Candidatus Neomarinimicrobiota bacterium]